MTKCINHPLWDLEMRCTSFRTINTMRNGAPPTKQNISQTRCNHAFGIHESRHPLSFKKIYGHTSENKITELQNN